MAGGRLNGWKEISSYLECGVKTAQRLEKESGLPVRRLPSQEGTAAGLSPVHAFTDELDRWRAGQEASAAWQAGGGLAGLARRLNPARGRPEAGAGKTGRLRGALQSRLVRSVALVAGLILAVYASVSWYSRLSRNGLLMHYARIEGGAVVAYAGDGRVLWKVDLGGTPLASHEKVFLPLQVRDLDGDGREEVLVAWRISESGTGKRPALVCINDRGVVIWQFFLDEIPSLQNTAGQFHIWELSVAARLPDKAKGIVLLIQREDQPLSSLAIVDPHGQLCADYEMIGQTWSHAIIDLDWDGIDEILVGGLDAARQEPFLASLRCSCLESARGGAVGPGSAPGCRETAHYLLGRTDVAKAMDQYDAVARIQSLSEDRLSVEVVVLGMPHLLERNYIIDRNLQVIHLSIPQAFKARHRELYQQGKLDHDWTDSELEKMRQFHR